MAVFPHGDDAGRHTDPSAALVDRARYNPIHQDDIIATIPKLLEVASLPAVMINWGGVKYYQLQEWCGYLGSLIGRVPKFEESPQALRGVPIDLTRMRELIGPTTVDWARRDAAHGGQVPVPRAGQLVSEPPLPDADVVDEHLRGIGARPGVAAPAGTGDREVEDRIHGVAGVVERPVRQ